MSGKLAMKLSRRQVLALGVGAAACTALPLGALAAKPAGTLKSMTGDVKPIGHDEYLARIEKARRLMGRHGIGALLVEPGASMVYFTGVHWRRRERLTA